MYLLGRPCGFTIIPSAIFCASRRFRFKKSFICSFSNPNASAISRFVFPASFISRISFSKSLMCVYFLLDIMTPLDVLLLSYIKGCFVYCPFLLVQFKNYIGGIAMPRKYEKVQELLPVVKDMVEAGCTYRQIAEKLGLGGKEVIEELLKRERRKAAQGVPMHLSLIHI